jgi:hypothetical protein
MPRVCTLILLVSLGAARPVWAEDQWGLSAGITPSWTTASPSRFLFGADQIDMGGSEVRFGVVRGDVLGSDWGFWFVDKAIDENSTLEVDVSACPGEPCGRFYRTLAETRLTGVEFYQFQPYKTWRDRVQLGMVGAVGVGWLRGTIHKRTVSGLGAAESFTVPAEELFPPSSTRVPLVKLEIAAAGIVAPGLKVRVGGGFSMPGYHTFGVTVYYFVPGN